MVSPKSSENPIEGAGAASDRVAEDTLEIEAGVEVVGGEVEATEEPDAVV